MCVDFVLKYELVCIPRRAMDQLFALDMGLLVCYCIVFSSSASLTWKSAFSLSL